MTTVTIAICDFFQIPSCQHNDIIELYSITSGVLIWLLHGGGGGDSKSNFTKICNLTSLGVIFFQFSKKIVNASCHIFNGN